MFSPVEYPEKIEPLVRLIEDTNYCDVARSIHGRLREGVAADDVLLASVLAVTRSTDLRSMACSRSFSMPLSPMHIRMHVHGPFILPESAPVSVDDDLEKTLSEMRRSIRDGEYNACEYYGLYLLESLPPSAFLEHLLQVAVPKNILDDHNITFPVFAYRAVEYFGWEHARHLFRPVMRFLMRRPLRRNCRKLTN